MWVKVYQVGKQTRPESGWNFTRLKKNTQAKKQIDYQVTHTLNNNGMETPKQLVEFFRLFTKPREVVNVNQLPNRKQIKFITRTILLLEQERKWYLEHDEDDLDYINYLDGKINKLVNSRNYLCNIYLHEVIKLKTNSEVELKY